jgi:hypothetical protein
MSRNCTAEGSCGDADHEICQSKPSAVTTRGYSPDQGSNRNFAESRKGDEPAIWHSWSALQTVIPQRGGQSSDFALEQRLQMISTIQWYHRRTSTIQCCAWEAYRQRGAQLKMPVSHHRQNRGDKECLPTHAMADAKPTGNNSIVERSLQANTSTVASRVSKSIVSRIPGSIHDTQLALGWIEAPY